MQQAMALNSLRPLILRRLVSTTPIKMSPKEDARDVLVSGAAAYYQTVVHLAPKFTDKEATSLAKLICGLTNFTYTLAGYTEAAMVFKKLRVDVPGANPHQLENYRTQYAYLNTFNMTMCYDPPYIAPLLPSSNLSTNWIEMVANSGSGSIITNIVTMGRELQPDPSSGVMTLGDPRERPPSIQQSEERRGKFEMYVVDADTGQKLYLVADTATRGQRHNPSRRMQIVAAPKDNIHLDHTYVWELSPQ